MNGNIIHYYYWWLILFRIIKFFLAYQCNNFNPINCLVPFSFVPLTCDVHSIPFTSLQVDHFLLVVHENISGACNHIYLCLTYWVKHTHTHIHTSLPSVVQQSGSCRTFSIHQDLTILLLLLPLGYTRLCILSLCFHSSFMYFIFQYISFLSTYPYCFRLVFTFWKEIEQSCIMCILLIVMSC